MSFNKLYTIFFALFLSFLHLPLTQGAFYDPKSSGTSDHYTVSNPLVLLTGASKYDKKEDCLSTVKDEMEILYDLFHKKCDYEVKSTFFDDKGNVFPKHDKQDKKKMDGEWLYKEKFDLWLDDQYDYLRTNIQTKKYDALFFIFSGHGSCDSYGRDSIITSDYIGYPWGDIEKKFSFPSHSDLKNWAGKCPKFFFKLACRGSHKPVVVKMKGPDSVNLASKTYTFYATSQGTATGASNGVHLAGFISQFFTSAVKKKKHLSWIDNRLKEQMSKAKYRLDAPACYTGLVGDKVFFSYRHQNKPIRCFPTSYEYALLMNHSYKKNSQKGEFVTFTINNTSYSLPQWKLYDRIKVGDDSSVLNYIGLNYGYNCNIYKHVIKNQIVIVFPGFHSTKNSSDLSSMLKVNIKQCITNATSAIKKILNLNLIEKATSISFTGHSLGGRRAQLSLFIFKEQFEAKYRANQVKAVTFEPAETRSILEKENKKNIDMLDITNYVSSPNYCNAYDSYIGNIYRVIFKPFSSSSFNYSLASHNSSNFLEAFDRTTGDAKRCLHIIKWPSSNKYKEFFKSAKKGNNYHLPSSAKYGYIYQEEKKNDQ